MLTLKVKNGIISITNHGKPCSILTGTVFTVVTHWHKVISVVDYMNKNEYTFMYNFDNFWKCIFSFILMNYSTLKNDSLDDPALLKISRFVTHLKMLHSSIHDSLCWLEQDIALTVLVWSPEHFCPCFISITVTNSLLND